LTQLFEHSQRRLKFLYAIALFRRYQRSDSEADRDNCYEECKKQLDSNGNNAQLHEIFYLLCIDRKDHKSAIESLETCVRITDDIRHYEKLLELYFLSDPATAEVKSLRLINEKIEQAGKKWPKTLNAKLALCKVALLKKDVDKAEKLVAAIIKDHPGKAVSSVEYFERQIFLLKSEREMAALHEIKAVFEGNLLSGTSTSEILGAVAPDAGDEKAVLSASSLSSAVIADAVPSVPAIEAVAVSDTIATIVLSSPVSRPESPEENSEEIKAYMAAAEAEHKKRKEDKKFQVNAAKRARNDLLTEEPIKWNVDGEVITVYDKRVRMIEGSNGVYCFFDADDKAFTRAPEEYIKQYARLFAHPVFAGASGETGIKLLRGRHSNLCEAKLKGHGIGDSRILGEKIEQGGFTLLYFSHYCATHSKAIAKMDTLART
jgi:hypothetical protein